MIYFILGVPAGGGGGAGYLVKLLVGAGQNRLPPITRFLLLQISARGLQLSFICSAACCRITSLLPTFSDSTLVLKPSIRRSRFLLDAFPTSRCTSL